MYTRTQLYKENSKNDLPLDTLLDKELCTVYGNQRYHWSDCKEALADCTHTGTLYRVIGFDKEFRVCLYFEEPADTGTGQEATYYLYIFERTNNITLRTGKDYYTDLFQFPENASLDNLNMEEEEVAAFVDTLLEAEFIDPYEEDVPAFDYTTKEDIYYISFTDSLGIKNTMELYENGYVVNKHLLSFSLQPLSEDAPQSLTYIEIKKGLQENTVSLRFADSEEELENKEFITLKKQ